MAVPQFAKNKLVWVGTYDITIDGYKWRKLPFFEAIAVLSMDDCLLRPVDQDNPEAEPQIKDLND